MSDAAEQKHHIQTLVRNASVEITPGLRNKIDSFAEIMHPGRRVFVTHLPGKTPEATIEACIELRQDGMEPIPHLAARSIVSDGQLYDTLERLREKADVRDLLLIGGSVDKPVGEFTSTIELLETGHFEQFGLRSIGVAGHPEGSPDIPEEDIRHALQYKNDYAKQHNIHMYIVTQFGFEHEPIIDWLGKIEEWGNQMPVNIGLPGPATIGSLMKYAKMCGVNCSMRFLTKQGLKAFRLASVSTPDLMIARLAGYLADHPDSYVTRLHFYGFGGLKRTMRFIDAIDDGAFDMKPFNLGFKLHKKL